MAGIAREVKLEVLDKVKKGEPVQDLSSLYGISTKTIYHWLKLKSKSSVSILEHNKLKKENSALKEIIGALTVELQKTKKKMAA